MRGPLDEYRVAARRLEPSEGFEERLAGAIRAQAAASARNGCVESSSDAESGRRLREGAVDGAESSCHRRASRAKARLARRKAAGQGESPSRRRLVIANGLAAAACVVLMLVAVSLVQVSQPVVADGDKRYAENEDGLTYFEGPEPSSLPEQGQDLVKVGIDGDEPGETRIGYVYREELEAADGSWVSNPDEAIAYMEGKKERAAQAWFEAINAVLGNRGFISREDAERVYSATHQAGGFRDAAVELAALDSVDLDEEEARDVMFAALPLAREALTDYIPVYEKDGKTQIGWFGIQNF